MTDRPKKVKNGPLFIRRSDCAILLSREVVRTLKSSHVIVGVVNGELVLEPFDLPKGFVIAAVTNRWGNIGSARVQSKEISAHLPVGQRLTGEVNQTTSEIKFKLSS